MDQYPWIDYEPQAGDVLGFSDHTLVSRIIELGTWTWPGTGLSHVGIVAHMRQDGPPSSLVLFESVMEGHFPCLIQGKVVGGVQAQPLFDRILTHPGNVWLYRPNPTLPRADRRQLTRFCKAKIGTPYDWRGAFDARETIVGWLLHALVLHEDLAKQYCSEFVADALRSIDYLEATNVSVLSPNRLVWLMAQQGIVQPRARIKRANQVFPTLPPQEE